VADCGDYEEIPVERFSTKRLTENTTNTNNLINILFS
jgi:hypothetical protein